MFSNYLGFSFTFSIVHEEEGVGPSGFSETLEPARLDAADPEDQEIIDLLLTQGSTPREPELITTPPPKVTKKKMKYVKQREEPQSGSKTPHWNPVGEAALSAKLQTALGVAISRLSLIFFHFSIAKTNLQYTNFFFIFHISFLLMHSALF